jgi:cytohesin
LDEEVYEWPQDEEQRICQVVAQLTSGGADIDARDSSQQTPLHLAVSSSLTSVAMFLIESGADFGLFTRSGLRPLDIAVQQTLDDLVDYIISQQDEADRKEELRRRKPSNTLDDSL